MTSANPRQPWGRICGLLAACGVTLMGVVLGHDPDVILYRAVVAGIVIGVVALIVARAVASVPRED